MKYTIIISRINPASMNIGNALLKNYTFKETGKTFGMHPVYAFENFELLFIEDEIIYAKALEQYAGKFFIFASTHKSAKGVDSFTTHSVGNWGNADLGGKACTLGKSSARVQRNYFLGMKKKALPDFEVTLEATHHGPTLNAPIVFIEIGSEEKEWKNEEAGQIIADIIIQETQKENTATVALGFGGTHYCMLFNKLVEQEQYAFSFIAPKHALPDVNADMLKQAIEKSVEPVQEIILDWKGLGTEKQRILKLVEATGLLVRKRK
jgi:D-aminoacyl-tRNA deacylase